MTDARAPWRLFQGSWAARRWRLLDARLRILVWASLIAIVCGAIEGGEPLEDVIKGARDVIRTQPASGDIVVVGIDDRTFNAGLAYDRQADAKLVDQLIAAGARRVFFDRTYAYPSTPKADEAFAAMLRRHGKRVALGSATPTDARTRRAVEVLPTSRFRPFPRIISLNGQPTPFALSALLTHGEQIAGEYRHSLSSALADIPEHRTGLYRPDWSINTSSIPTLSFIDVLNGRVELALVRGRDVVIGPTATALQDVRSLIFQGFIPGVHLHVVGAETLQRGNPVSLGWMPPFALSLLCAALLMYSRRGISRIAAGGGLAALIAVPLLLDGQLITVDIVPSLLLFAIVLWRRNTYLRVLQAERTNTRSSLPNFSALEEEAKRTPATLIVMKLANLPQIAASFDRSVEGHLILELCRRIRIDPDIGEIYHGEDALCWLTPVGIEHNLAGHLEGLHRVLTKTVRVRDRELDLSITFGIDADSTRPIASRLGSALMCADEAAAAYEIWKLYDPLRQHEAAWQLALMSRLDHALDNEEIFVVFQPKIELATKRICGVEALIRWHHPERGMIDPVDFVRAAENHNRIERLTLHVLGKALTIAMQAEAIGHMLSVAINVSPQLLASGRFFDTVFQRLEGQGVSPGRLTLEVTETGRISPIGMRTLKAFKAKGITISLDDFGSGDATLERLRIVHPDEVKIDRQFIHDLHNDAEKRELVRGTISMARSLNCRVVAEGVERQEEIDTLGSLGCDVVQGFLTGKPMTGPALLRTISSTTPELIVNKRY